MSTDANPTQTSPTARRGLGRGLEVLIGGAGEPELQHVPIEMIHPNPRQPRRRFEPEATSGLAASIRHPRHVVDAAMIGADVATIPPDVLKKLLQHPLTDRGLETFLADWSKLGAKTKASV